MLRGEDRPHTSNGRKCNRFPRSPYLAGHARTRAAFLGTCVPRSIRARARAESKGHAPFAREQVRVLERQDSHGIHAGARQQLRVPHRIGTRSRAKSAATRRPRARHAQPGPRDPPVHMASVREGAVFCACYGKSLLRTSSPRLGALDLRGSQMAERPSLEQGILSFGRKLSSSGAKRTA
jgi:hypothetical protein